MYFLLDLQNVKPGTTACQPGLSGLTPPDSKGASNIAVLLDSGGPGTLRTQLELSTRSWRHKRAIHMTTSPTFSLLQALRNSIPFIRSSRSLPTPCTPSKYYLIFKRLQKSRFKSAWSHFMVVFGGWKGSKRREPFVSNPNLAAIQAKENDNEETFHWINWSISKIREVKWEVISESQNLQEH